MALSLAAKVGLGVVITASLGYLVLSDTGEGVLEYMYVDKLMSDVPKYENRTLKVHGQVVKGSIQRKKGTTGDLKFIIECPPVDECVDKQQRLAVHFTNDPPDTFQEEGEVVLTGQLKDGVFESDEMSAKCPSKYEEEQGTPLPGGTPSKSQARPQGG